jgi:hypothetical protein
LIHDDEVQLALNVASWGGILAHNSENSAIEETLNAILVLLCRQLGIPNGQNFQDKINRYRLASARDNFLSTIHLLTSLYDCKINLQL